MSAACLSGFFVRGVTTCKTTRLSEGVPGGGRPGGQGYLKSKGNVLR